MARGCGALAPMYLEGVRFPRDAARASGLLKKACDGGDSESCVALGRQLIAGERLE